MVDEHMSSLTVTGEEIENTERLTRGQNKNEFWYEKRKTLLTASNFGKAAKTKVEPSKKIKAMPYTNFTTEALQYGIESEEKAVALYIWEMQSEGINVKVEDVGLMSKEKPFLAASLDRIITNQTANEKWGMEIKSPFSKAGMTVEDVCKAKNFFLEKLSDGTIRLKRTHDYYIQTQGQLFVSSSSLALKGIVFLVYFGDEIPLFRENIFFERSHWNQELLPKLEYFFKRALFPEMVTKRVQKGKLLYLHGGWAPYGQYACTAKGLKLTFKRAQ